MQVFFIAGLPRSGSTLLSALLNQNPDVHAEPNSGLLGLLWQTENAFSESEQLKAYPKPDRRNDVCKSIVHGFYAGVKEQHIVDKNRNWAAGYAHRIAMSYVSQRPKIVCCVRSVVEILASYVDICNRSGGGFIDAQINPNQFFGPLDDDRCEVLMMPGGKLSYNLNCLQAALKSPFHDDFLLVEYDDLVTDTQKEMNRIYRFWGIEPFTHTNHIEERFVVDDGVYGIQGLHSLKGTVEKTSRRPEDILSPKILKKYSGLDFWRD